MATGGSMFKGEIQADKSTLKTLYDSFRQTIEDMTTQVSTVAITILYIPAHYIATLLKYVVQHVSMGLGNTFVCT